MTKHSTREYKMLYEAVLALETPEECQAFFEDVCTIKELEALAQRLQVASALYQGKNYNEVYEKTGVSTATICRVNKCLNYGDGGYRTVLERLKDWEDAEDGR